MKAWYFVKWLFDISRWEGYTKRFASYTVVGVLLAVFVTSQWGMLVTAAAIWLDILFNAFKWKYEEFKKEQTDLVKTLKGEEV